MHRCVSLVARKCVQLVRVTFVKAAVQPAVAAKALAQSRAKRWGVGVKLP